MKNTFLKLLGLLLLLNVTLWADTLNTPMSAVPLHTISTTATLNTESNVAVIQEIALDSFGNSGMVIMIILSSLLGMFFVRDEFDELNKFHEKSLK